MALDLWRRRNLESEREQASAERQQLEAQLGKMAGDVDRHSSTAGAADANVRSLQLQLVALQAKAAQQEQEVERLEVRGRVATGVVMTC